MLRALVRLTTGVELGGAAITVFIGASIAALVSVGVQTAPYLLVEGLVMAGTLAIVALIARGIWRRYRRLIDGRCGHPACRGTVASSDTLPEHLVICSNCKWVWPRLAEVPVEAPAG